MPRPTWFPDTLFPKWLKKLMKILFFIGIAVSIMLIVLGNIGGRGNTFKASIEQFATESTGYFAEVTNINNIKFFPNIIIYFNNLRLFKDSEKTLLAGHVQTVNIVASFWDVLLQNGRFKMASINNLIMQAGTLSNQDFIIDDMNIHQYQAGPTLGAFYLLTTGYIGKTAFTIELPLSTQGHGYSQTFNFETDRPTILSIGDIKISGQVNHEDRQTRITNLTITDNNKNLFKNKTLKIETDRLIFEETIDSTSLHNTLSKIQKHLDFTKPYQLLRTNAEGQHTLLGKRIDIKAN